MPKRSAGVLLFRRNGADFEVLLAHPGGPLWKNKDDEAWSIPKGEYNEGEDPLAAAKRELNEETGVIANGEFIPLGEIRQSGGKLVTAWALEGSFEATLMKSNTFFMRWPPGSTTMQEFREIDRAQWFPLETARRKILKGQTDFLDRLALRLHRP